VDDQSPLLPTLKIQDGSRHAITNLLGWGVCGSLPDILLLKGHKSGNQPRFPLCFVKKTLILRLLSSDRQRIGHALCDTFATLFWQNPVLSGIP